MLDSAKNKHFDPESERVRIDHMLTTRRSCFWLLISNPYNFPAINMCKSPPENYHEDRQKDKHVKYYLVKDTQLSVSSSLPSCKKKRKKIDKSTDDSFFWFTM